jgi:hypothetical protein
MSLNFLTFLNFEMEWKTENKNWNNSFSTDFFEIWQHVQEADYVFLQKLTLSVPSRSLRDLALRSFYPHSLCR